MGFMVWRVFCNNFIYLHGVIYFSADISPIPMFFFAKTPPKQVQHYFFERNLVSYIHMFIDIYDFITGVVRNWFVHFFCTRLLSPVIFTKNAPPCFLLLSILDFRMTTKFHSEIITDHNWYISLLLTFETLATGYHRCCAAKGRRPPGHLPPRRCLYASTGRSGTRQSKPFWSVEIFSVQKCERL